MAQHGSKTGVMGSAGAPLWWPAAATRRSYARGKAAISPGKRLFDIMAALCLIVILSPAMIIIAVWIAILDGRPVIYVAERMKTPTRAFGLLKFRTMHPVPNDHGATGGHKRRRLTRTGPFLRRTHLDELPQIFNVLRGDISMVGPRPPLRLYVAQFPDLYARVLASRPGITGLATLVFHRHEERILSACTSATECDRVYASRCVPRKARIDLIYQRRRSVWLDLNIMVKTVFRGRR